MSCVLQHWVKSAEPKRFGIIGVSAPPDGPQPLGTATKPGCGTLLGQALKSTIGYFCCTPLGVQHEVSVSYDCPLQSQLTMAQAGLIPSSRSAAPATPAKASLSALRRGIVLPSMRATLSNILS